MVISYSSERLCEGRPSTNRRSPRTMTLEEKTTETEERILEAALQVFSMKGKDGARMQEIADLAGINKALLHYYFRSKDGLYDRVFEYVITKLVRSFGQELREAQDFFEMLRIFIDSYIDFVRDNLAVMRLMVAEHLAGGERVRERIRAMMESPGSPPRLFLERVTQAASRGEIRPADPHQTLITILSCCVFFFLILPTVETFVPAAREDRDVFIENRKDHVFDVLAAFLRPLHDEHPRRHPRHRGKQ